jgi:glutamine synthetase
LSNKGKALQIADELLMEGAGFNEDSVKALPRSCYQSAKLLEKHRDYYEKGNVFPKRVIDGTVKRLKSYNDENLNELLRNDNEKTEQLIREFIYCG